MRRMRAHTTDTRDYALNRLRRINRWMIAGSIVLTGVLADVAANAFPGRTLASPTSKRSSRSHASTPKKASPGPLAPPAQTPQAAPESTPSPQSPAQESPAQPSAPAQESPPVQESAPSQPAPEGSGESAPESSPPVVSGGS
jgi:hypothetical protein